MRLFTIISFWFFITLSCKYDATDKIHCKDLITDTDTTGSDSSAVFVPNAFTPNGDELNDNFAPLWINIESAEFTVYSTRGKKLFSTRDLNAGFIPKELPKEADMYLFRAQALTRTGRRIGVCGEFHAVKCVNKNTDIGSFRFADQLDPSNRGFVNPTSEQLQRCN